MSHCKKSDYTKNIFFPRNIVIVITITRPIVIIIVVVVISISLYILYAERMPVAFLRCGCVCVGLLQPPRRWSATTVWTSMRSTQTAPTSRSESAALCSATASESACTTLHVSGENYSIYRSIYLVSLIMPFKYMNIYVCLFVFCHFVWRYRSFFKSWMIQHMVQHNVTQSCHTETEGVLLTSFLCSNVSQCLRIVFFLCIFLPSAGRVATLQQ